MPRRGETLIGLRRGIEVLEHVAGAADGLGFGEIKARFEDLAASTLSRLLKALQEEDLLLQEAATRRYVLGPRAATLGRRLRGPESMAERVKGVVERLAYRTGHSAAFCEFQGEAVVLTAKSDRPESFHYAAEGNRMRNLAHHCFALVCLAHAEGALAEHLRRELREAKGGRARQPWPLDRAWEDFEGELEKVRRSGVRVNHTDDQPGLKRIAAAVLVGPAQAFAGAIGVSFFHDLTAEQEAELVAAVQRAAGEAAQVLAPPFA